MLKKAGFIVAGSVAALLAVSPLAFATDGGHHGENNDRGSAGAVSVLSGNNTDVPVCGNDAQGGLVPFQDIDPNVPVDVNALGKEKGEGQASPQTDVRGCEAASGDQG